MARTKQPWKKSTRRFTRLRGYTSNPLVEQFYRDEYTKPDGRYYDVPRKLPPPPS